MKRWISLLLALVMVLSMLTGLAGAEGVLTTPQIAYMQNRQVPGGMSFGLRLDGEEVSAERIGEAWFSNEKLGEIEKDENGLNWNLDHAYPHQTGTLFVMIDNVQYELSQEISTGDASFMYYVGDTYSDGGYLGVGGDRTVLFEPGTNPVITFELHPDEGTIETVTDYRGNMVGTISTDGQTAIFTTQNAVSESFKVILECKTNTGMYLGIRIDFVPQGLSATSSLTNLRMPGSMSFDFLLNGEVVDADRISDIQLESRLGVITKKQSEWGQFEIDLGTAYPQQQGTLSLQIDGDPYTMPVSTAQADFGFYTSADFSPESYLFPNAKQSVFFEDGQPQQIWFKFTRGDKIKSVSSSSNLMQITHNDPYIASFTVDPNFQGSFDTYLEVESENGGFFGINLSVANVRITTIEGGPVDRESQLTDLQMGPGRSAPFRIKGYDHDFYMSISRPDSRQPGNLGGMQPPMDPGQMEQFKTCISFWKDAGEGVYAMASDEETAAILEAFGTTLSQNLYTIDGERYPDMPEAKFYPTIHVMQDNLCTITVEMTLETAGAWVYYASGILYQGTDDEEPVDVPVHFDWMPRAAKKFFQPEGETPAEILEEINDFLKDYVEEKGVLWIVQIPEGEYEGLIEISNEGWGLQIDGIGTVILHGGVVNNSGGRPNITNIHFVGQGASNKKWTTGALVGSSNMAIYGNGGGRVDFCTFSGYDYAIYTDMITGVYGCAFAENNVAIMEDHEDGGGNPDLANNVFERNKIALNFEHIADRLSTVFFNISHNKFIDNQWDVRNKLKRSLYLPGNFFGRTDEDGNLEAVPCNHQIGSGEVVTMLDDTEIDLEDTSFNTQIFAYPRATDPSCRTWVKEETAVLYNGHAAEFQIAEENVHGTTFIVMDEESELVQMVFPEAAPISMLAEGGQFDASVGFQTSDENDLVLMINDTLGLNPLVRLPLTGSDVQVLDPDGNKIETNYQDGSVEITAGKGGDYTMAASLRVNRLNAHMMAVNLGSRGTGKQVVVAVYEPSGKLADLQIPENVTGFWMYENQDLDLTACEVKVMLVDGDYVPGCEAVTLEAAAE